MALYILYILFTSNAFEHCLGLGGVCIQELHYLHCAVRIQYFQGHANNSYCGSSHWKAARNTANRQTKLDETGLVVADCRHSLAQSAVNMHQGELYGYTHYLQINRLIHHNVKFLWQDVICKYWPWFASLRKDLSPDRAFSMAPALSIMHGKAHVWSCQVLYRNLMLTKLYLPNVKFDNGRII